MDFESAPKQTGRLVQLLFPQLASLELTLMSIARRRPNRARESCRGRWLESRARPQEYCLNSRALETLEQLTAECQRQLAALGTSQQQAGGALATVSEQHYSQSTNCKCSYYH